MISFLLTLITIPVGWERLLVRVGVPVVFPGRASSGVDTDKGSERYNVNNGHLSPVVIQICQNTRFACATLITKLLLIVAPKPTVDAHIVCRRSCINNPIAGIDIYEIARRWRLATSPLNRRKFLARKLLCGLVNAAISDALAGLGIFNTGLYLPPVVGVVNAFLHPVRIVTQLVFFKSLVRRVRPISWVIGHHEGKDREAEEQNYE